MDDDLNRKPNSMPPRLPPAPTTPATSPTFWVSTNGTMPYVAPFDILRNKANNSIKMIADANEPACANSSSPHPSNSNTPASNKPLPRIPNLLPALSETMPPNALAKIFHETKNPAPKTRQH